MRTTMRHAHTQVLPNGRSTSIPRRFVTSLKSITDVTRVFVNRRRRRRLMLIMHVRALLYYLAGQAFQR